MPPLISRDSEKLDLAVAALRRKHSRATCDDGCPTLVVLEALARLQDEVDDLKQATRELRESRERGRFDHG